MSNWLNNVNNLLSKLDDQVETAVEERAFALEDLSSEGIDVATTGINGILAKRGLSSLNSNDVKEEKETELGVKVNEEEYDKKVAQHINDEGAAEDTKRTSGTGPKCTTNVDTKKPVSQSLEENPTMNLTQKDAGGKDLSTYVAEEIHLQQDSEAISSNEHSGGIPMVGDLEKKDTNPGEVTNKTVQNTVANIQEKELGSDEIPRPSKLPKANDESTRLLSPPSKVSTLTSVEATIVQTPPDKEPMNQSQTVRSTDRSKKEIRDLVIERKEAQKEARTLRRHIVSLNNQLESAESELQAQRKELDRAAERIEKDCLRNERERGETLKRSSEEILSLKTKHAESLKDQQARFEEQLERYRKKLSDEEKLRKQQGGDWDKEISSAIDRENSMRKKLNSLEDEKSILLSQISTLQAQQTALGSRLESLSQAADNAMQRERDVENRLDDTLNQHARQIHHRQARESQLERTIQDLNAALVVSRGDSRLTGTNSSDCKGGSDDPLRGKSHLEARISALELDLRTTNSHLAIEKERSETLQIQLRSFSNETTHEATIVHEKEVQYNRQIADMAVTISKLEEKVRQYEKVSLKSSDSPGDSIDDQKLPHQIKVLSEEVFRLREKIVNQNSESLAMKSRLQTAVDRSKKLEEDLHIATSSNCDITKKDHSLFLGKRRNHGTPASIRTAMLLNSSNSDRTEQIGQVVDQIDSFAASTGKYLRRNPLARAGFIFYLILIHLWTFVLLFFHAHSFDTYPERDPIAGNAYPHGPHAIMQQQHQFKKNIVLQ
mmetsp:Transcript_6587/g.16227  ORF Transcript_6587/g.16227 Transcript_6587/m.16227 type:complete len:779 (-) Transcript_6587:239-2575(-)|eukprot:CAMPEP_0197173766 /NCGR_PEP_ID=MMETSP1423-20130617/565_1 /TAXON_ID=476441 /ORGANISM="Pseudo-nitzschia heimii, Strain UNC1101" /LENGTH=778 /DNA_ID=CAMNT_0042622621 /DNA_START=63 /DNA_END=2399 /DNA_ORIENTATION=+